MSASRESDHSPSLRRQGAEGREWPEAAVGDQHATFVNAGGEEREEREKEQERGGDEGTSGCGDLGKLRQGENVEDAGEDRGVDGAPQRNVGVVCCGSSVVVALNRRVPLIIILLISSSPFSASAVLFEASWRKHKSGLKMRLKLI